jgi:hypothetical protein
MNKKYVVKYEIYLITGEVIKNKEIKIANCLSDIEAKIRLEKYLEKKHKNFKQLVVHNCVEDILGGFGDIFGKSSGKFNDIFGKTFGGL